jgi:hypothetical protein
MIDRRWVPIRKVFTFCGAPSRDNIVVRYRLRPTRTQFYTSRVVLVEKTEDGVSPLMQYSRPIDTGYTVIYT